jgi:hypothetical protein
MLYAIQNKTEAQIETISIRKRRTILVAFSMIPIYKEEMKLLTGFLCKGRIEEKRQEKRREQLIGELTQNNKDLKQFSYIHLTI